MKHLLLDAALVTMTTKKTVDKPGDTVASTDIETNTVVSSCPIPTVRKTQETHHGHDYYTYVWYSHEY